MSLKAMGLFISSYFPIKYMLSYRFHNFHIDHQGHHSLDRPAKVPSLVAPSTTADSTAARRHSTISKTHTEPADQPEADGRLGFSGWTTGHLHVLHVHLLFFLLFLLFCCNYCHCAVILKSKSPWVFCIFRIDLSEVAAFFQIWLDVGCCAMGTLHLNLSEFLRIFFGCRWLSLLGSWSWEV